MATVQKKMIGGYCFITLLLLLLIGGLTSWKLNHRIEAQAQALNADIIAQTQAVLEGHNRILHAILKNTGHSVHRQTKTLCTSELAIHYLGSQLLDPLARHLRSSCEHAGIDFAVIFDIDGRLQASHPAGIQPKKAEPYFNEWETLQGMRSHMSKVIEQDIPLTDEFSIRDPDFFRTLDLAEWPMSDAGAMLFTTAGVIADDFGDPIGYAVVGKILNGFDAPMKQLFEATGTASGVYIGNHPIALFGFGESDGDHPSTLDIRIPGPDLKTLRRSDQPLNTIMTLGGRHYVVNARTFFSSGGHYAGISLTGTPLDALAVRDTLIEGNISTRKEVQGWILIVGVLCMISGYALFRAISARIETPLREIAQGLAEAMRTTAVASDQIAESSTQLAEGAAHQAAASQEASAALAQLSATSRETSSLTCGANQLMDENIRKSIQTVKLLVELTATIEKIESDSDKIGQIIKTIDGIAFQTNLLALNAAVEAARAGEAGSGFAVVADEVRSLAKRTAEAAANTQKLLDTTIRRVGASAQSIKRMNADFEGIIRTATVMGDKTFEITAASIEQATSIGHISRGVNEMDQVTQQVAANAEEFTGSVQSLKGQADLLKTYSERLSAMVGKNGGRHINGSSSQPQRPQRLSGNQRDNQRIRSENPEQLLSGDGQKNRLERAGVRFQKRQRDQSIRHRPTHYSL